MTETSVRLALIGFAGTFVTGVVTVIVAILNYKMQKKAEVVAVEVKRKLEENASLLEDKAAVTEAKLDTIHRFVDGDKTKAKRDKMDLARELYKTAPTPINKARYEGLKADYEESLRRQQELRGEG